MIDIAAAQYQANLLAEQGKFKEAYELLEPLKKQLEPEAIRLLHQLAYRTGNYQEVISLGNRVYQDYPNYETALINAFSYSLLGQAVPAIGWLQGAVREGLPNPETILHQHEFDKIRDTPAFQDFAKKDKGT